MNRSIVVVEDEPDVLMLLRDLLEMSGFQVSAVNRPELVPGIINNTQPDLLLLDLMLPGMSGIELAQQIRDTKASSSPIIAISASRLMLEIAEDSGLFVAAVSKPFDIDPLLSTIEQVLTPDTVTW